MPGRMPECVPRKIRLALAAPRVQKGQKGSASHAAVRPRKQNRPTITAIRLQSTSPTRSDFRTGGRNGAAPKRRLATWHCAACHTVETTHSPATIAPWKSGDAQPSASGSRIASSRIRGAAKICAATSAYGIFVARKAHFCAGVSAALTPRLPPRAVPSESTMTWWPFERSSVSEPSGELRSFMCGVGDVWRRAAAWTRT